MAPISPATTTRTRPREVSGGQRALIWLAARLLRLWTATLRIEIDPASRSLMATLPPGTIFLLWHNRLLPIGELRRRFRRPAVKGVGASGDASFGCSSDDERSGTRLPKLAGLVSASRDGGWLAAFFREMGIHPVRGSTSRGGRAALRELRRLLADGWDVGITPDGPRGPCYNVQPGAWGLARLTGAPVCLVGLQFRSARRLDSWDGLYLPAPFSRVSLTARAWTPPGCPPPPGYDAAEPELPMEPELPIPDAVTPRATAEPRSRDQDESAALANLRCSLLALNPDQISHPRAARSGR